jgi:hypothetical protein
MFANTCMNMLFPPSILKLGKTSFADQFVPIFRINPLKAKLNLNCHLLILLGDLTFMGPCIISIFQYISNKMQRYTFYLYLETALLVSGVTSTHHQERIHLYLQHLIFVTPLLLSAAISWNRFECAVVGVRHPQHTQTGWFQLFHDSGR